MNTTIIIGPTGAGKSATANTLAQATIFKESSGAKSCTTKSSLSPCGRFCDTQGLSDSDGRDRDHMKQMIAYIKEKNIRIGSFLLVIDSGNPRLSAGLVNILNTYQTIFPLDFWNRLSICFTKWSLNPRDIRQRTKTGTSEEKVVYGFIEELNDKFGKIDIQQVFFIDNKCDEDDEEDMIALKKFKETVPQISNRFEPYDLRLMPDEEEMDYLSYDMITMKKIISVKKKFHCLMDDHKRTIIDKYQKDKPYRYAEFDIYSDEIENLLADNDPDTSMVRELLLTSYDSYITEMEKANGDLSKKENNEKRSMIKDEYENKLKNYLENVPDYNPYSAYAKLTDYYLGEMDKFQEEFYDYDDDYAAHENFIKNMKKVQADARAKLFGEKLMEIQMNSMGSKDIRKAKYKKCPHEGCHLPWYNEGGCEFRRCGYIGDPYGTKDTEYIKTKIGCGKRFEWSCGIELSEKELIEFWKVDQMPEIPIVRCDPPPKLEKKDVVNKIKNVIKSNAETAKNIIKYNAEAVKNKLYDYAKQFNPFMTFDMDGNAEPIF